LYIFLISRVARINLIDLEWHDDIDDDGGDGDDDDIDDDDDDIHVDDDEDDDDLHYIFALLCVQGRTPLQVSGHGPQGMWQVPGSIPASLHW
jgi:hypothetical protein